MTMNSEDTGRGTVDSGARMTEEEARARLRLAWARIVAEAWADPEFKRRAEADPAAVLREHGIDMGAEAEIALTIPDSPPQLSAPLRAQGGTAWAGDRGPTSEWWSCITLTFSVAACISGTGVPGASQS
ncbi:MAG TPA: hypothetical protein VLS89_11080 [Candidatus Nanopelagicales bacterium]|nr:hypothetical protein [Candidatus Nanopelagicales bacterium]